MVLKYLFHILVMKQLKQMQNQDMTIFMQPTVLRGDEIIVSATRAVAGITPVAFSNLTAKGD